MKILNINTFSYFLYADPKMQRNIELLCSLEYKFSVVCMIHNFSINCQINNFNTLEIPKL